MLRGGSASAKETEHGLLDAFATRSLLAFAANILARILKIAFHLVVSRSLGVIGYGAYTVAFNLLVFIQNFTIFELDQALIRFVPAYRATGNRETMRGIVRMAWIFCTATSVIAGACLFAGSDLLGLRLFHSGSVAFALKFFAVALVPFTWVVLGSATAQAYRSVGESVLIQDVVLPVAMLAIVLSLAVLRLGLVAPLLAFLGGATLAGTLGGYLAIRRLRGHESVPTAYSYAKWFGFGGQLMVIGGAALVFTSVSPIALAIFGDVRQVGVYNAALMVVLQTSVLFTGMAVVLPAVLAELFSRGATDEAERLLQAASRWLAMLGIPLYLVITSMAAVFLGLFGNGFSAGTSLLLVLAAGNFVTNITVFNGYALVSAGLQKVDMWNHIGLAIVAITGYPIAARMGGAIGVAIVTSGLNVLLSAVKIIQVRTLLGIRPWDPALFRLLGLGLLAAGGYLLGIRTGLMQTLPQQVAVLLLCLILYSVGVHASLTSQDRLLLRSFKQRLWGLSR